MTPPSKIEAMCEGDAHLSAGLEHLRRGRGGRTRGGGEGGVMSRWVKITWQARADHTQAAAKNLENFVFGDWRSPWEVLSKHCCGKKGPGIHCHTHTHTHTHTQGSSYPNLNSLDGRRPRLNNPRFLPGLGSAEQSMTPADVCTINEPLPHTELWTVSVCIIWHCQCLSSEVKWADSKLI